MRGYHAITPATKHTAHYFFGLSRDFGIGNEELGGALLQMLMPTLEEDMFATGEIEKMISQFDSVPDEVLLKADTTCVMGRRLFTNAVRAEMAA